MLATLKQIRKPRHVVPALFAILTQRRRYIVTPGQDFVWNPKCWVFDAFRIYEFALGRRSGIRWEGSSWHDEHGIERHAFGTLENRLAHYEGKLRATIRLPWLVYVPVPQLLSVGGISIPAPWLNPFRFSLAFDAAENTASTTSLTHVCTGSNRYLFASTAYSTNNSAVTGTYNSVALTSSATLLWIGSTNVMNGMYLANPSSGSNTYTATGSGGGLIASSYSGCDQGAPDSYNTNTSTNSASIPLTLTTAVTTCWGILFVTGSNGTGSATSNCTVRANAIGYGASVPAVFDSNGYIGTGGYTLTTQSTSGSGQHYGQVGYSFKEAAGGANTRLRTLLGVGS